MEINKGQTYSLRLNEETDTINKALEGNNCTTFRELFVFLAKKAMDPGVNNNSELEKEIEDLKAINKGLESYKDTLLNQITECEQTIENLKQDYSDNVDEIKAIRNQANENGNIATSLQLKLEGTIKPLPGVLAILNKIAEKLNCTPADVVNDYVIKYNVEQRAALFHPFYLSKIEATEIIKSNI
ncbi:MAG: hypothetical protein WC389_12350 [Lutibacter sp.]|jgi:predicted RNase H-like nuclease (RuvC/YqgF family)